MSQSYIDQFPAIWPAFFLGFRQHD